MLACTLYYQMMILLVTFNVPHLRETQHLEIEEAMRKGLAIMREWKASSWISPPSQRVEEMITKLGIEAPRGTASDATALPNLSPKQYRVMYSDR